MDAVGKKIMPGFIDIHTHGAVGIDVNGASAEDLEKIGSFFAGNGTTAWLASVLTDTGERRLNRTLTVRSSAMAGIFTLGQYG